MAQQVTMLATKTGNLSLMRSSHRVERENWLSHVVPWPLHVCPVTGPQDQLLLRPQSCSPSLLTHTHRHTHWDMPVSLQTTDLRVPGSLTWGREFTSKGVLVPRSLLQPPPWVSPLGKGVYIKQGVGLTSCSPPPSLEASCLGSREPGWRPGLWNFPNSVKWALFSLLRPPHHTAVCLCIGINNIINFSLPTIHLRLLSNLHLRTFNT